MAATPPSTTPVTHPYDLERNGPPFKPARRSGRVSGSSGGGRTGRGKQDEIAVFTDETNRARIVAVAVMAEQGERGEIRADGRYRALGLPSAGA